MNSLFFPYIRNGFSFIPNQKLPPYSILRAESTRVKTFFQTHKQENFMGQPQFIDLSISIEPDLPSDPPMMVPKVESIDHLAGAQQSDGVLLDFRHKSDGDRITAKDVNVSPLPGFRKGSKRLFLPPENCTLTTLFFDRRTKKE
jgi:hypothetical protein